MENENVLGENFDNNNVKPRRMLTRKTKRTIFYICTIAFFIFHTLLFYVYVNFSMFALAFEEYYVEGGQLLSKFTWFTNFKYAIDIFLSPEGLGMLKVSTFMFLFHMCVGTVLALILSYYIYKKVFMSEFFRVILFLPSIISAVVMVTLFRYMVDEMYMEISKNWFNKEVLGLLHSGEDTKMFAIIIYNIWMGYGMDVLLYTGAMSGINESTVEASELDGCTTMQEFWYITLPSIFPTLITFIIGGFANFFTNQMHLFTFYDRESTVKSVGYYMYVKSLSIAGYVKPKQTTGALRLTYSELSAMGLLITAVTLPIVLTIRFLLNKYGPSPD